MVEIVPASSSGRADPVGEEADNGVTIERREKFSAVCKWQIKEFSKMKQRTTRCLYSKYFEVGGFDCRLLVYPAGDAQALPGYISIYLQVTDPKNATGRWDCFASYRLCITNQANPADSSKDIARDSWHRFSAKRKSHGWCDFAQSSIVLDPSTGYAVSDSIMVKADILVLCEQTQSVRENEPVSSSSNTGAEILSGKFTWKVCNFGLFREMIKTQKIMSPAFNAGECNLRLSVYQSAVNGMEFLSMCLESKDTDKSSNNERSCWCLFRMSVLSQTQGGRHMHRDSYGRFAADSKTGDNTSLGWNDFMSVAAFTDPEAGYLCNDVAVFSASFHIIKESSNFNRSVDRGLMPRGRSNRAKGGQSDGYQGKFTWKIEHFTRLKELLKKRKITGLCIKSRRFQVGGRDCRLIVYPRGQSQPPNHLSMFLEVTDSSANGDWSCFVSHRLSVVNQRPPEGDKSVAKESQNRYSKQAKDWGWREFVTLTSLFDLDAGFLVNDCVQFAAEVLVLKETSELKSLAVPKKVPQLEYHATAGQDGEAKMRFSWKIENFVAFKEIMETRKIFSRFFSVEGCDLRIGVYESFDTLCIYLESDAFGVGLERNFWVKYRIAILNQKYPERTEWKEAAICTKTWNNSVLQFMKVTEMVDPEAGYIQRDGLMLACEVIDCQPWFDFADLEVFVSDSEAESLSTDPEEILDSEDSDALTPEEEDTFRSLLGDAGLHVMGAESGGGLDMHDLQQVLSDKMHLDSDAAASFVAGLHLYMDDDPYKIKRLLQPGQPSLDSREPGICLFDLLMGIEVLQAPLLDLLLDVLLQLCHQQPKSRPQPTRTRRPTFSSMNASASLASAYSRFNLESREDGECASSSAMPNIDMHAAKVLSGNDSSSSGTATPQEGLHHMEATSEMRPPSAQHFHGAVPFVEDPSCNGNHMAWLSGREKAEELIMIAFRWLATVDQFMCLRNRTSKGRPGPFTLQKVQNLLAELPRQLQPQLVLLVPKLVSPMEHTTAAGILLARLAEASREGVEAEQELRLPVLSALGLLSIEPQAAEKVLHSALEALPALSDSELAPAVGLILKLASECSSSRGQAVHSVRRKVWSCPEVSGGTLDAIRLAVIQHEDIATAMLADIDAECRQTKPATSMEGNARDGSSNAGTEPLQIVDLEVLLDLLRNPVHVEKTRGVIERAVLRGRLNEVTMAVTLEQRRIRLLSSDHMQHHFFAEPSHHPEYPDQVSGLRQPLQLPDDSEAVLALAEVLAPSKSAKLKMFAAALYQTVFRVTSEESRRGLMLRALIARAAQSSACQSSGGSSSSSNSKDRASANASGNRGNSGANSSTNKSPRSEQGQAAESRPDVDVTTPEGLLLTLISQYPGAAKPAVILMMLEAQAANAKATAASRKLQEVENGQDKALKEAKAAANRHQSEAQQLSQRLADVESERAELRRDHAAEATGFATTRRELEERVRNLERELDWVHGEREEEQTAVAHERRETAGRLRELEAASNRLKSARKDDLKRVSREKAQALDRCKELESSNQRLEAEVRRLNETAQSSLASQESLSSKFEDSERAAKAASRRHEEQVADLNKRMKGLQAACSQHQQQVAQLETQLREEVARSAPLHGLNLDRLSAAQLDSLARLHEKELKRAKALQGQKRSEESAAATALAAANAVTGGPPPRQLNFAQHGMAAPQTHRSNSSMGSADSMMSLGMDMPLSASLRNLPPGDRAPGSAQLTSARSADRPNGVFSNHASPMQRSMTPGLASYYQQNNGLSNGGGFHLANATLPNGFPNGLLSGTGLLNGQQQKGNGTHKLW